MNNAISIHTYNDKWPFMLQNEAKAIIEALPDLIDIHHVGSTSVPSLSAKPIIDIIVVVRDRNAAISPLEKLGYTFKGEYNIPFRSYFNKAGFNLHMYEEGHSEITLNLTFRDFLRTHPKERQEYEALKNKLANESDASIKKGMFKTYTLGKDAFIKECLKNAGYIGIRFLKATHYTELDLARRYCDDALIQDPNHHHLVLYEGIELIGYGHVDPRNIISYWVKEKWEKHFKELLLKWVKKEQYVDNSSTFNPWSFNKLDEII